VRPCNAIHIFDRMGQRIAAVRRPNDERKRRLFERLYGPPLFASP